MLLHTFRTWSHTYLSKGEYLSKPDVSNLRVFGSTAWARIPLDKRKSLQPQSVECILIGYAEEAKRYKLLNIITKNILIEISFLFE